ncbi:MAG: hypothetical protein ACR2JB_00780 [Bryobacteraceae bacterium]
MDPTDVKRRLNFNLSAKTHGELVDLARETNRSMTDLIRFGVALLKIAVESGRDGQRLVVTTSDGREIKEIVLPGF